ncbi:hypothetical protein M408DRAFT_10599 [Serendipita vermifera MAFF 305830]|uniref:Uncharacterized protein n=1 Tax=Serendipita vermifera MAFF 305830 TaxID=933852 RepID=A0A0C3AL02_SERVB|nr:hypothetical protein M408DRAFT_10599 [Serendipita vermifera MAFF 305830]
MKAAGDLGGDNGRDDGIDMDAYRNQFYHTVIMDSFEHIQEAPDLSGQVVVLDGKPIFTGSYSCVYKGELREDGQLVAIKVINAVRGIKPGVTLMSVPLPSLHVAKDFRRLVPMRNTKTYRIAAESDAFVGCREPFVQVHCFQKKCLPRFPKSTHSIQPSFHVDVPARRFPGCAWLVSQTLCKLTRPLTS